MKDMTLLQPYTLLPAITTLHLEVTPRSSKAILEIMTCFPNLARLEIVGSWIPSTDLHTSAPIFLYCPNLKSLSFSIPENSQQSGVYILRESELANPIVNLTGPPGTGKLNTFEATLFELDGATTRALVKHARDTLEVIEIYLDGVHSLQNGDQQTSFDNVHYILANCCNLRKFSIQYDCDYYSAEYLGGSWACLDTLEEQRIHGGWYGKSPKQLKDVEVSSEDGCVWIWRTEVVVCVSLGMLEMILAHVKNMPYLWRLYINGT